jgi:hypothetical protein
VFAHIWCCVSLLQLQKKRLQSQSDDKKTEKDKLFAEQRAIKETVRGPSKLQVRSGFSGLHVDTI